MIITPDTYLDLNTQVRVKGQIGMVSKVIEARDQHGIPICLHTVDFKTDERNVNYSFIDVLCSHKDCLQSAIQFSMGQAFCKKHQVEFAKLHEKFLKSSV